MSYKIACNELINKCYENLDDLSSMIEHLEHEDDHAIESKTIKDLQKENDYLKRKVLMLEKSSNEVKKIIEDEPELNTDTLTSFFKRISDLRSQVRKIKKDDKEALKDFLATFIEMNKNLQTSFIVMIKKLCFYSEDSVSSKLYLEVMLSNFNTLKHFKITGSYAIVQYDTVVEDNKGVSGVNHVVEEQDIVRAIQNVFIAATNDFENMYKAVKTYKNQNI